MIEKLLKWAEGEIGTKEDKNGKVKYNEAYGLIDQWCVMFVWYGFRECGFPSLFYDGGKCASCTRLYEWAQPKGLTVSKSKIKRGDLIIFEFSTKSGISRHIGICEAYDGTYVTTIDGNTCTIGNESDGGRVMRKKRHINTVKWVIRPKYSTLATQNVATNTVKYYVVKSGDYFDKVAKLHGLTRDQLKALNPQIKNINIIYVGQKIRVQ